MSDIIRVCRPDPGRPIFVLGGVSWRISIHTQQARAIMLVDALAGSLTEGDAVAVVGGGACGLTCAAALARIGMRVRLFEKSDMLMPLQRKNSTRFIHPNSVTWPRSDMRFYTDLPFLNWHADLSKEVAYLIESEFRSDFAYEGGPVTIELDTLVTAIERRGGRERLRSVNRDGAVGDDLYAAIFIASGFGEEKKISGYDRFSYWEDTSPVPLGSSFDDLSVAIIGDGDGALLEVFRCVWGESLLEEIYESLDTWFFDEPEVAKRTISEAEERARRLLRRDKPRDAYPILAEAYKGLAISARAEAFLRDRKSLNAKLTLISAQAQPFSPRASPAHKVLLAFLKASDFIKFRTMHALQVSCADTRNFYVTGKGRVKTDPFRRVIERLGPDRDYCPLCRDVFSEETRDSFRIDNKAEFDVANPLPDKSYRLHMLERDSGEQALALNGARLKLQRYFQRRYPQAQAELSLSKAGADNVLTVSYSAENAPPAERRPETYLGYQVIYQPSEGTPKAPAGHLRSEPADTRLRGEKLALGHLVFKPTERRKRVFACITAIVQPTAGRAAGGGRDRFVLTAAHSLSRQAPTKILTLGVDTGDDGLPIGIVDQSRFANNQLLARQDARFSCLRDVMAIKLDAKVSATNTLGGRRVASTKSSIDHFFFSDGVVELDGHRIGQIKRVRAETTILDAVGNRMVTNGFFVAIDNNRLRLPANFLGFPILTSRHELIGMLIAQLGNELFCLDMHEVLERMGCELAGTRPG